MGTVATRVGRLSLPNHVYHVTSVTVGRRRLFDSFLLASTCARTFANSARSERAELLAWVLMPDHVHWLIHLGASCSLASCVRRLKSASARQLRRDHQAVPAVWQPGYFDHALRDDESVEGVARYIVANPLRAGLVTSVRDYPFWDAIWL